MTKVILMNIGEGTKNIPDLSGRAFSFPCGVMGEIDLHDAHRAMFNDPNKSKMVVVPADTQFEPGFIMMMNIMKQIGVAEYNVTLRAMHDLFGKNSVKQRPQISVIRARLARIATAYAAAGFTNFAEIAKMEEQRPEIEDGTNPDQVEAGIRRAEDLVNRRPTVKLNVPRHMQLQMAEMEANRALVDEEPSGDIRASRRVILGRVPSAVVTTDTPRPVNLVQQLPSASAAEPLPDRRTPEQIAADIEAREGNASANNTLIEDDGETTDEREARLAIEAGGARAPRQRATRAPSKATSAKATKRTTAKKAPAKKATKKAGSRR